LESLVKDGKFRQDLFHRVYVFPVVLPPLRERREDISILIEHFARQVCAQNNWKPIPFSPEAIQTLQSYAWPGNVRELRNTIERLILMATEGSVTEETVSLTLPQGTSSAGTTVLTSSGPLADRVQQYEREVILAELKRNHNHITNTAKALGLERSHLYKKAEQVGIDLQALRQESGR
jgi:DNA-binding NtrC family response regulator